MKRLDIIKEIYKIDTLLSLASDELTEEEEREMLEQLRQLQEQQSKLKQRQVELQEEEFEEEPDEFEEEPEAEEEPKEIEPVDEEPVPDEEKVEMPSSLETETPVETEEYSGVLKKYSPGAILAKTCPTCHYDNRPIYTKECQNCKKVYNNLKNFISMKRKQDPKYSYNQAFEEFASKFKHITPKAMAEIYWTKGETPLKEVNEIEYSPRKHLEDVIWYRLNVKKDKNGEPILDKYGMPVPLDEKKYFGTPELTEALHLSPEMLRKMIAEYNAKIIENLPPETKKMIRKDQWGEILPSSAKQLEPYGYVAPAVTLGTGMADVRRRLPPEQEDKLSPEQVEGLKGPAFKSVDISAWNWDKLGKVFGFDKDKNQFTHGWGKFLTDKFIPMVEKQKAENRLIAVNKLIEKYKNIAESQRQDVKDIWNNQDPGLKFYMYLSYNPEVNIENFQKEWEEDYENYKDEYMRTVAIKRKVDRNKKIPPSAHKLLENYDKRKKELTEEEYETIVNALSDILNQPKEKIIEHLELRDDAIDLLKNRPKEVEFMGYLKNHPDTTREKLENQFDRKKKAFEKFVWAKKEEAAKVFDQKAERLEETLPELEAEVEAASLPHEFDLNEEVKKYFKSKNILDPDPKVNEDLNEELQKIQEENPLPEPPNPEEFEKESSRLDYIMKLAVCGSLFSFAEEKKTEENETTEEELETPKKEIPKFITPAEKRRMEERREKRRKFLENLTPEQKEELEYRKEEAKTQFQDRPPVFKEPSESPETKPIRKIITHNSMVVMKEMVPVINPLTGKPKRDAKGETIEEEIIKKFPKKEKFLITIRLDDEGKPKYAQCETISLKYEKTLDMKKRTAFPDLHKEIRFFVDKKFPELRKEERWEDRKELIDKGYEKLVEQRKGEEPWRMIRKEKPLLPESAEDLNAKPCKECPSAAAPFNKVCDAIQVALDSLEDKSPPPGYEVYDWETIEKVPPSEKTYETIERRRRKDVTDFFADDKQAKKKVNLIKESAEYQRKKVKLNDPIRNPSGSKKKFHVFVKDKSGKVKKLQFGDPNMEIKRDDPERRKSFRARHKCDQEKDKTTSRYWSCYQWRKGKKVNN